jgi:hypothetical protein
MSGVLEEMLAILGSQSAVAEYLQYSERQYLNIRRRVERGEELKPRVECWIRSQHDLLKKSR